MKSLKEHVIDIIQIILSVIVFLSGLLNFISVIFDIDNTIITLLALLWVPSIWVICILEFIKKIYKPSDESEAVPYERIVLVSLIISVIGLFTLILNGIVAEVGNEIEKTANIIAIFIVPSASHFLSIFCCIYTQPNGKYEKMNKVGFGISTFTFSFTIILFLKLVLVDLFKLNVNIIIISVIPVIIATSTLSILIYKKRLKKR